MADINEIFMRYDLILENLGHGITNEPNPGTSLPHLRWMLHELTWEHKNMPYGKVCRWLGFIQGVMIMNHLITVSEERDFTRSYFKNE